MDGEKTKRTRLRPIILLICFVLLIGLSASAAYLIVRVKYQSQLNNKDKQVLNIRKNYEALAHQNLELRNSLQKLEDEYSKLQSRYKDAEPGQTAPESVAGSKGMLVLKPTWVSSNEPVLAFEGNFRIVLHKASDKDECPKDSAAVGYFTSDTNKTKLCLRTGRPENFTYQGKNYLLNLSGIVAHENVYRYCISISLDR